MVVVWFYVDQVVQVVEVGDFLQEDQLYGIVLDKLFVSEVMFCNKGCLNSWYSGGGIGLFCWVLDVVVVGVWDQGQEVGVFDGGCQLVLVF